MNLWSVRSLALFLPLVVAAGVAQAGLQETAAKSRLGMKSPGAILRSLVEPIARPVQAQTSLLPAESAGTAPLSQTTRASQPKVDVPPPMRSVAKPPATKPPATSSTPAQPKVPTGSKPDAEIAAPVAPVTQPPALRRLAAAPAGVGLDNQIYGSPGMASDRAALLKAIDHSLAYLATEKAAEAYGAYPIKGVTRDRVRRSLQRFKALVQSSGSAQALQAAVRQEFDFYQSTGKDGQGTVHFTGYFEPSYAASRQPTAEYRYPLYAKPADLESWPEPHPNRTALEGKDGLQAAAGPLKGLELVWLKSRLEAFLVQVQGSAKLQLTDGSTMSVGYAGTTNYPYVSLGKELVNDGIFSLEQLTLPLMLDYFRRNPQNLSEYLPRNDRFIFFKPTHGAPPTGSLAQPVTADRSLATDKSLMPPGALTLISTQIPYVNPGAVLSSRRYVKRAVNRYGLDQDTGSAIKGPGRVDLFLGSGSVAGDRAGLVNDSGQLYYLLLKDGR